MNHTLSVLVDDKPGVLTRVTELIARRGYNIESLAVGVSEDPTLSRVTMVISAPDVPTEQIIKQLHKLINVHKITDLSKEESIDRELVLFKVDAPPERRHEVIEIANLFRVNIIDVGKEMLTIEATGTHDKLDALEDLFRTYGLQEIARTGVIALTRCAKE